MRDLDLSRLRMRLLRGGVAPKHVSRTLKELRHHLADLEQKALSEGFSQTAARARAVERLGDPSLIVDQALARPELRSWAYRWPWAIYGMLPVVALASAVVGSILIVVGLLEFAESTSGLSPAAFGNALFDRWWAHTLLEAWRVGIVYLLPVAAAGALCVFAANRDAPILWPTIGVFLVLFLGFCYDFALVPPPAPDQLAQLSGGIGFSIDRLVSARGLRLVIPLMLVLGPYHWWRHSQRNASSA